MDDEKDEVLDIPLVWVGIDDLPIVMANQYLCQTVGPNQFVLTVGQGVPPPLLG